MKRKYQVRWYEYGLTIECRRNFFTKFAAVIYAYYVQNLHQTKVRIRKI